MMPIAKRPKPKPARWQDRARKSVSSHPWSWGTAASIVGVMAIIPIVAPYLPEFQTAEAAEAHAKQDAREFSALVYGQQRIETLILRGRVNECRRASKPNDRQACSEYEQEYRAAAQRERVLFEQTQRGGK